MDNNWLTPAKQKSLHTRSGNFTFVTFGQFKFAVFDKENGNEEWPLRMDLNKRIDLEPGTDIETIDRQHFRRL